LLLYSREININPHRYIVLNGENSSIEQLKQLVLILFLANLSRCNTVLTLPPHQQGDFDMPRARMDRADEDRLRSQIFFWGPTHGLHNLVTAADAGRRGRLIIIPGRIALFGGKTLRDVFRALLSEDGDTEKQASAFELYCRREAIKRCAYPLHMAFPRMYVLLKDVRHPVRPVRETP
jgi:hypothetical protein